MNLRSKLRGARGVTLIELVVVIAVAGILATVASPTVFRAIKRERQRQVANDVANVLRTARNQAMSRGEAITIALQGMDVNGGGSAYMTTYRNTLPLPTGTAGNLGDPCNPDLEDISTDDCLSTLVCEGGTCREPRYDSCRSFYTSVSHHDVAEYRLENRSSANMGMRTASAGADWMICFDPDGRVSRLGGQAFTPPSSPTPCDSENLVIYLGDLDASWADYSAKAACGGSVADYETVGAYVIRVGHNGEVALRSPK